MSCIYLDGKKIDFEKNDYNYLNEGLEAEVYRYKNLALKFYKEKSQKMVIDKELVEYLKTIDTKRYLLPTAIITDDSACFLGYATLFKQHYQTINNMPFDKFIDEVKFLEEDTLLLSEKGVDIEDLSYDNTIYNGSIYLIDPGSFKISMENKSLSRENLDKLNTYVIEELLGNSLSKSLSKKKKTEMLNSIKEMLKSSSYELISDFLKEEASQSKNLKECPKRLIKL